MVSTEALEPRLHLRRQRVVGGAHIGELGFDRNRRDDSRREHRVASGRIHERRVGMPEAITEPVHATTVAGRQDPAGLVDVRDVGERLVPQAVPANGGSARPCVELTVEALREIELLGVGEWLIAEDEHGVLVHPLADLAERFAIMDRAKVDRTDLGDEARVEPLELQRHPTIGVGRPWTRSQPTSGWLHSAYKIADALGGITGATSKKCGSRHCGYRYPQFARYR